MFNFQKEKFLIFQEKFEHEENIPANSVETAEVPEDQLAMNEVHQSAENLPEEGFCSADGCEINVEDIQEVAKAEKGEWFESGPMDAVQYIYSKNAITVVGDVDPAMQENLKINYPNSYLVRIDAGHEDWELIDRMEPGVYQCTGRDTLTPLDL